MSTWSETLEPVIHKAVAVAASSVSRSFSHYMSREDVQSEIYAFAWKNRASFDRYLMEEESEKRSWNHLVSSLKRAGEREARRQRAIALGFDHQDEYFYDRDLITDLIFSVGNEYVQPQVADELEDRRSTTPMAERGNWFAMLTDVRRCLDGLEPKDRAILLMRFADEMSATDVGRHFEISRQAIDDRVDRSLTKMLDCLGGPSPWRAF